MSFLAAAVPIIAGVASLAQGVGGLIAGKKNKATLDGQADEEIGAFQDQERELRKDARRTIGAQLAAQWGNGFEGGTGTALDAIRESELDAVLDAREIRRQGVSRYRSLRAQGKQEQRAGYFALGEGMIGGVTAYGQMRHDWAQARTGSSGGAG